MDQENKTKVCSVCKIEKALEDFVSCKAKNPRGAWKDGKTYACRECHNARRRAWGKKNRAKENAAYRGWAFRSPTFKLWSLAKARAKKCGCPFSISWRTDIVIPEVCPILGITLKFNKGCAGDDSPSLDRIIPELGYVLGNIAVISHKANTMKSNASVEDLKKLVAWLESKELESKLDLTLDLI